ncbi:hypothetical protein J3A83DRAFT_640863 [Scleroderma citrinum]
MTTVRFSWGWPQRLTHGISSLLRNVRPKRAPPFRSRRSNRHDDDENQFTSQSTPAVSVPRRPKSSSIHTSTQDTLEKGKRRAAYHVLRNDSTPNVVRCRGRSIEEKEKKGLPPLKIKPPSPSSELVSSRLSMRRGSRTLGGGGESSRPSSRGNEETNGRSSMRTSPDERTRHRFSLSSMKYWRSQMTHHTRSQTPSQASSPLDNSSLGSSQDKVSQPLITTDITLRRSDEVLRHRGCEYVHSSNMHGTGADTCGAGLLTAARRASSWGEPMNYVEDVTSLASGEHDGLDEDAMFLGAGGVCKDPSTLTTNLPIGLSHSHTHAANGALRHPQPERLYIGPGMYHLSYEHPPYDGSSGAPGPSSSAHDGGSCGGGRPTQLRSATTSPSPLQRVAYESDDESDDDDDDEDDDEGDEDAPIEVKRRRPSLSVTAASPPLPLPPPLPDFSDQFPVVRNLSRSPARESVGYYERSMLHS